MTTEELNEIIKAHALWLENKGGKKADLREADLREADLLCADLRGAQLQEADLRGAQLQGAQLQGANLREANLREADLRGADLRWAQLQEAALQWADLQGANLQGADLREADLLCADLREADLLCANLQRADLLCANLQRADLLCADLLCANLRGANLQGANLRGANLQGAVADEMTSGFWSVCPESGGFFAFKKLADDAIAKLFIPEHAKRSSATTRKCRCSEALVLEIKDRNGNNIDKGFSQHKDGSGCKLLYRVGETVYPDGFDENRWNECSNGIHFFMTRREAEIY